MKKITKQDNEEYCNGNKMLTKNELKSLAEILEAIENVEYRQWKHINGGYAEANMFNYDDDTIDISLESGEQDTGSGFSSSYTSNCTIPRDLLPKKMSLEKKLEIVKWGN